MASPLADDVLQRLVEQTLSSPETGRLVVQTVDRAEVGLAVLLDEIARSPAVTAAISQRGVGFANQVAGAPVIALDPVMTGWSGSPRA